MALTRQQKEARVQQAEQDLKSAASVVFITYDALTVDDTETLRDQLHEQGASIRVLPKRLLQLVLKHLGVEFDPTQQPGQMAVVWGDDVVLPAKVTHTFAKDHETVQLLGGTLEGKLLSQAEIKALALLPTREELMAKFVGTIANPLRGLQAVLSGVQRQAVQVLAAVAEQKGKTA